MVLVNSWEKSIRHSCKHTLFDKSFFSPINKGDLLVSNIAVAIGHANVPLHSHAADCLLGLAMACACLSCEFFLSAVVAEMAKLQGEYCEKFCSFLGIPSSL